MNLNLPIAKVAPHDWQHIETIPIAEVGEPLVSIPNSLRLKQSPIYFQENIKHAINVCVVRESVLKRLTQAVELLPEHLGMMVLDGWRSREVQRELQNQVGQLIDKTYPDLSAEAKLEMLNQFVAPVSPDFISPHLTGGSVDVSLFDLQSGKLLDMGSDFDEPSVRSYSAYYESHPENKDALMNRRMLYNAMTQVGFSNLPTEWWHFDFGNQLWAHYTKQDKALFGVSNWNTIMA